MTQCHAFDSDLPRFPTLKILRMVRAAFVADIGIPCIPSNRLKISDIVEGSKKSLAASSFLEYYLIIIGE
jgi:hypothetical protein